MALPESSAAGRRRAAAGCALVFLVVFGNFLISAPRGVMLDDDGYFILAAWFDGVAHPPGYPLFTAFAHLGTLLPLGSVAWRVHLVSALFGALACACLWGLALELLGSRRWAYAAALGFGFSRAFWSQSIVAEVYSLNALFLCALLLLAVRYARDAAARSPERRPHLIALLFGLSLSNHWPLMLLSAPALAFLLWPKRRELAARAPALAALALAGLAPYLWMTYRSRVSEIAFFGPIGNWTDFWFYLSRKGYAAIDHSATATLLDKARFAGFALREAAVQIGPLGAAFAAFGAFRQARAWTAGVCAALVALFLGSTFALIGLLGLDYDPLGRNVFAVYPIPAYVALALWAALGLREAAGWLVRRAPAALRAGVLECGAAALLIASAWIANAPANLRSGDRRAEDYAEAVLATLPPDAVLFVAGDYSVGPVGYLNRVQGVRPDVTLMSLKGQLFSNRLYKPTDRRPENMESVIDRFIRTTPRPIFYFPSLPHRYGAAFDGLHYEVLRDEPPGLNRLVPDAAALAYFDRLFAGGEPRDGSELIQYRYLTAAYCTLIGGIAAHAGATDAARLGPLLDRRCGGFYGLVRRADALLTAARPDHAAARALLAEAERRAGEAVQVGDRALVDHLYGRSFQLAGDDRTALSYYAKSLRERPDGDNPSWGYYAELRRAGGGAAR